MSRTALKKEEAIFEDIKTRVSPFNRLRDSCQARLFDRLSLESMAEEQGKEEK